ncbi:MAG: flagellar filament capping protein FliD [Rhodoferax sp.]|nr:flagellar filament capping protein FliD [Rhodoferax sp.]
MATISSPGIGSELDVKSIVTSLVDLEKRPLEGLKLQAATVQTKISAFGQIKSQVSALSDAASTLSSLTTYNAVTTTSSNTSAVTATAIGGTAANNFSIKVDSLAKAQSTASGSLLPVGGALGAGTLRLQLGKWTVVPLSFLPQVGVGPVDIVVNASDTVTDLASKINGANAGVSATVLNDASGQRLLLRSRSTGEQFGFQTSIVSDDDGNPADAAGLSRLVTGSTIQYAADARIQVNDVPVSSSTNTFTDVVSGVTLTAVATTTSEVDIAVTPNRTVVKDALTNFVSAFNAINQTLNELTKYDAGTKTAGLLQGDSTAIGLQNALRGVLQSTTNGSAYKRLADIGVTQQLGGALAIDGTKLDAALANGDEVKNLLRIDNSNQLTNGVALKFKKFSAGLLEAGGFFSSKDASLKRSLELNAREQTQVNAKAARVETNLYRRYNALDVQLNSLSSLNAYVTQQITLWNKSTG